MFTSFLPRPELPCKISLNRSASIVSTPKSPHERSKELKAHTVRYRYLIAAALALLALAACSHKTAEEKGAELAAEKIDMAKGMGDVLTAKGESAGEAVATGIGTVFKGIEKGVVRSGRAILMDASVDSAGLKITTVQDAKPGDDGITHGLDVYIVANTDARGKLRVLLFDAMDKEIGRTSVEVHRTADEGKYQTVSLDPQVNLRAISKVAFTFKANDVRATN
jgi:hypothetical protein